MRTRFSFCFESEQLFLDEPQAIKLAISGTIAVGGRNRPVQSQEVETSRVTIEFEREIDPEARVDGQIHCTVPGEPEHAFPLAQLLVTDVAQLVEYLSGAKLTIVSGVVGYRIAESEDEEKLIGDRPGWAHFTITEVPPPIPFDRAVLRLLPHATPLMRHLRQYNLSLSAPNPVDKYLGLFKIIESLYWKGRRNLAVTLRQSQEFLEILTAAWRPEPKNSIAGGAQKPSKLISELIEVRDKCAHLREHRGFGYWPGDREVFERVEPLTGLLDAVIRESMRRHFQRVCPDVLTEVPRWFAP